MTSLRELKPGERGTVVAFGADELPARLLEMGVLEGTEIEVVRLAPLGDPIEIKVRGYYLSLRKREAEQIEVERA